MRILVTGGAGFIGGNLVFQLLALDGEVFVVDDLSSGSPDNLDPRAQFRKLDICSEEFRAVVRSFKPDVIVHLAAISSVADSTRDPENTYRVNIEGTENVIDAAIESGVSRMVFASSAAVYGDPISLPLREESPKSPLTPYGETKLEGEHLIQTKLRDSGVDFAIFRFANVYGPRQGLGGEGGVISAFASALAAGETPSIEGDGKQIRDFIFVSDVVFALISAIGGDIDFAGNPMEQVDAGVYNIGTGEGKSIEEVAANFRMVAQFFGTYGSLPPREGDIHESVLDSTRARDTFEFMPDTAFDKGVEMTYAWFQARHDVDDAEEPEPEPFDMGDPLGFSILDTSGTVGGVGGFDTFGE